MSLKSLRNDFLRIHLNFHFALSCVTEAPASGTMDIFSFYAGEFILSFGID